ncbi:hypothetical protein LDENG_00245110, partial [Lucifuga dentata]
CYANDNQKNWNEYLPLLTATYRSSPHVCTGFTPNRMMLGCEVLQPHDIEIGVADISVSRATSSKYS